MRRISDKMKIPASLSTAFGDDFEATLVEFLLENELITDEVTFRSDRFLTRSVIPHVLRFSTLFNRIDPGPVDPATRARKTIERPGLDPYWKESSNPENFRLAYFLAFMPGNMARTAAVISELARLGFRFPSDMKSFRGIEWGAGPASGACGVAAGLVHSEIGIPREGNWALIEQDRSVLSLGEKWASKYFESQEIGWSVRPFHRKVDFTKPLLPHSAPKFHLWLSSFFLNEAEIPLEELAARLVDNWEFHLENEGLAILVEPALKVQSRRLLELRKHLIAEFANPRRKGKYQVLLPCLGHQTCGALAAEADWCHEEVTWWRPKYFRKIDELAGLDRKTLPFSYLVVAKSARPRDELLPALKTAATLTKTDRLVSPAHSEGRDLEFYVCGENGKRRARYRPKTDEEGEEIQRGTILIGADIRGDSRAGRVDGLKDVL